MWSVWLVFCDCGFHSVCLMAGDKRLVEASWLEGLAVGRLGLALMGETMLSKSLSQFSDDRWGCVPSLLFGLRPKSVCHHDVSLRMLQSVYLPPSRLLLTHTSTQDSWTLRQVWLSVLRGDCSFLLGPHAHKVLFVSIQGKNCFTRYWWLVGFCPTWDGNKVLQAVQFLCFSTKPGNIILALDAYDRNFFQLYTSFEINSASIGMIVLFVKRNKLKHVRDSSVK